MTKSRKYSTRAITIDAMFIALTFAFTFINIKLPIAASGGLVHLGNVPLFAGAVIFGRRTGALAGAIGMGLFDLVGGWTLWAPFTFVIVGIMGFVVGSIAHGKNLGVWTAAAFIIAGIIKVVGYYFAELALYGNWFAPLYSIPGNVIQITVAAIISFPLIGVLKRAIR